MKANVKSLDKGYNIEINNVLKNTYLLLGMTVGFSALMAWGAGIMGVPPIHPLITIAVYFALLFGVYKTSESSMGLVLTFAFTGWLGFTLGPILSMYASMDGGPLIIGQALGGTALIFLCLSAYTLIFKPDMSNIMPFLFIGLLVAFGTSLVNIFFLQMPLLSAVISGAFLILASGLLMWQTSEIVNGGETNYIMATITIFVSLYNIFVSLLNLLTFFGGDD